MMLIDKIRQSFASNTLVWILLVLLAVAEIGNYWRGRDLSLVCELTGPHDISRPNPQTDREKIDKICLGNSSE